MPMPRPAAAAIPNEVRRASSAAASAGTTCRGSETESSWVIDAASTPTVPATTEASSVLAIDSWLADRPASIALTSFSEAARVASPKRLKRYRAASRIAITTTMPASRKRSSGTVAPSTCTTLVGRIDGCGFCVVPKASSIDAWAINSTPSDDTSLANGDALRSGRNAINSIAAPTSSVYTNVRTSAGAVAMPPPISPVFSAQKQ